MTKRFTRKFDPAEPRDPVAELYDTHRPPPRVPIPQPRPGTVLVIPGGEPHSLFHTKRDCEALVADARLAEQGGHDSRARLADLSAVSAGDDPVGCPLCAPDHAKYRFENCSIEVGTGLYAGLLLLRREHPESGPWAVVAYWWRARLLADIRPVAELLDIRKPT